MAGIFDNIQAMAKKKKLSINELEKKAGVSIGSTYKWNTVSPTIKNLEKVSVALGCTIEELLTGFEESET